MSCAISSYNLERMRKRTDAVVKDKYKEIVIPLSLHLKCNNQSDLNQTIA